MQRGKEMQEAGLHRIAKEVRDEAKKFISADCGEVACHPTMNGSLYFRIVFTARGKFLPEQCKQEIRAFFLGPGFSDFFRPKLTKLEWNGFRCRLAMRDTTTARQSNPRTYEWLIESRVQ